MKKIYVTPMNKVRDLSTQEGILLVASDMVDKDFDTETSLTDQGAGEDFGRNNNRNTNIWDQGW